MGRFEKHVKLHHLPKKQSLTSAWLRAISRSNYKGGYYTYVCSDHFPDGQGRTWKHEVPTLFLPQKSENVIKKRTTRNSTVTEAPSPSDLSCFLQENKDVIVEVVSTELELSSSAASVLIDHQYSSHFEADEKWPNHTESSVQVWTQTETAMNNQAIQVAQPEISVEDIQDSNDSVQFYTGVPDFDTVI